MAELILEHFFFRFEIIADEIDKLIQFAKRFPLGHIAWVIKYARHPMRPFLKYFNFGHRLPEVEYEVEDEDLLTRNNRNLAYNLTPPLKRISITEIMIEEPEQFEDALESQGTI